MASNAHELEPDGDTVMQSINQLVHAVLVKWVQARDQYEETVRQRCLDSRERPETAIKPVKVTVDRKLLEVICLYELRQKVEDVSNEDIVLLIKQRIDTVKNEQIPDLDEFFKTHLKIDLSEDDVDARVLKYSRDFSIIIENHGLTKILGVGNTEAEGFADRMKLRCAILIDNLEPRMVRKDVMRHCKYECREAKRNALCCSTSSKRKHEHNTTLERRSRSTPVKKPNGNTAKNKGDKIDSRPKQPDHGPSRGGSGSPPGQTKEIKPPITGCWYCKGSHWLRDCPTATEEDKKQLYH
ncbi:hypothetical protein PHMEG_00011462 [Phytophthora megakarya]|uniref:Uncharacterized protein n=1 Tax=Phytophthora megakarya TaxID=4795 RepID=A0A225WCW3_9STRA|nr:hypothetical protein PHMEG_00011462 [Phytophthora megakarya]